MEDLERSPEIPASTYRVVVVGGYGFFGRRLVELLAKNPRLHVIIMGRSSDSAEALAAHIRSRAQAQIGAVGCDVMSSSFEKCLKELAPHALVHTSGPFQGQGYHVAEVCVSAGVHYIDLADGREFVTGIGRLNAAAISAGVLVTSGASSVPALSCAVVDHMVRGLAHVGMVDIGISPGNRTERGLSTVQAILSYCGKALPSRTGQRSFGWTGTYAYTYPEPVRRRLLSPCDVPDLMLLPQRYAGTPFVRFGAGLQLQFLHRGMNLMAWAVRAGFVRNWATYAPWLKRTADLFQHWGTDAGAMHVSIQGQDSDGALVTRKWHLVARAGDGPYVPALAASALVRKLAAGELVLPGATPCVGLLRLEDFAQEALGLNITMALD